MKKILVLIAALLPAFNIPAEVFIGSSNSFNVLSVPANQTMLISSVKLGSYNESSSADGALGLKALISRGDVTNEIKFLSAVSSGPYAITGACDIVFSTQSPDQTSSAPVIVSYKLLQNSPIRSILISAGETGTISVPAGRTVRFFTPTSIDEPARRFGVQKDGAALYDVTIGNGDEFSGPLTITKKLSGFADYSQLISYYFTEDFLVFPETGYLQGPSGTFELAVEKSENLTNWFPVVVHNTTSDQKAFYRLRLQK